jgi:hypothetical protein
MSSPDFKNAPRRAEVQRVICPRCKAEPSVPCQGRRGDRKANHIQRVEAFKRVYHWDAMVASDMTWLGT